MSAPRSPAAVADPVVVPAGTTCADAVAAAGLPLTGPTAVVVVREHGGRLRDLAWVPEAEVTVAPVSIDSPDGLAVLRHSTAHVLAQAVQDLYPEAKLGIGPPIEHGFYYDFAVPPFRPEDLANLERRMYEIIKSGQQFRRRWLGDLTEARKVLAEEPFKLDLLKGSGGFDDAEVMEVSTAGELTAYDNVDPATGEVRWWDLCRGPHLPSTRLIDPRGVRLMRTAAAYWRGNESHPQLQRVYGTAWPTRDALNAHLKLREEAARRDHRRLGADLDLFSFPEEIGSGLAVFHPKGGIVRRELEDYSRRRHEQAGYEFVHTPHITKSALFETSGHLDWYADGMFPPMSMDGADYYLKPMNCPFHCLIYRARGRSYRELPLRLFEFGGVYRYEKSGVVHGLTRVRGFTQDDAHIYCTPEQIADELSGLLAFVLGLLRDYGLTDFEAELATRPGRFVGKPAEWDIAEGALGEALRRAQVPYRVGEGEGTFYAPKIDVHVKDAIGRSWQLSTLQVDFQLPARFDLEYQAADGSRQRPYMIHRALFGSIERFFGILTEHYAGAFPAWLAPVQVVGIPVRDDHADHLDGFVARLRAEGLRAEVDTSTERMQKKIRTAQKQKVPFMAIAGDDDVAAGAVSFRYRDGSQRNRVPLAEAVAHVAEVVRSRTNTGPSASA